MRKSLLNWCHLVSISKKVVFYHTCKNLIPMVVTRAMANSSKNHALLMCRIWKMGWNFFSSLDIRENPLFVLFPALILDLADPGTCYKKKILIAIFIMLQKNTFGQKFFWISCTGSKVPFWQKWKIAKMALLNPCMKFKNFFGQKHSSEALWKWR